MPFINQFCSLVTVSHVILFTCYFHLLICDSDILLFFYLCMILFIIIVKCLTCCFCGFGVSVGGSLCLASLFSFLNSFAFLHLGLLGSAPSPEKNSSHNQHSNLSKTMSHKMVMLLLTPWICCLCRNVKGGKGDY